MIKNLGTQTIETERLILRRLTVDDAEVMFNNWTGDDSVTRYLKFDTHKTIDTTRDYLIDVVKKYVNLDFYSWGIQLKNSGLIGSIGSVVSDKYNGKQTFGYCIGKKWWGQGYVTEATKAMLNFLHKDCGITEFVGYHSVNNPASGKIMEKCGLKLVGTTTYTASTGVEEESKVYELSFAD